MKHHRYSLEAGSKHEMCQLKGNPIESEAELREAFKASFFHYQFHGGGMSRIMRCSTERELEFLVRQLRRGAFIVIQRGDVRPRPG